MKMMDDNPIAFRLCRSTDWQSGDSSGESRIFKRPGNLTQTVCWIEKQRHVMRGRFLRGQRGNLP